MTLLLGEPSPGFLVAVITPHAKSSSTKSAPKARRSSPMIGRADHRLIPDDQLFTGKDLTVPIEQDNSNIRHFLARFRRRTKVVSKVVEMVDLSLRIDHHFHDNLDAFAEKLRFSGLSLVRTLGGTGKGRAATFRLLIEAKFVV